MSADDDEPYGPGSAASVAGAPATSTGEAAEEEDAGPFRKANDLERKLVMSLTSALKVSRLHTLDNVVTREALEEFIAATTAYLRRREHATVVVGDGRIFVNGAAMKGRRTGHSWLDDFVEFMDRLGIGGLVLKGEWTLQSGQQLLDCFGKVHAKEPAERVLEIANAVTERLLPPAEVVVLGTQEAKALVVEGEEGELDPSRRAAFYFARLVALAEASHIGVYQGRSPDLHIRHLRMTIMKIIEHLPDALFQVRLLAVGALRPSESDPLASHAAAVATLSLAIGRLLGLSRGHLADLAFAAMFHDLGRAIVARAPDDAGSAEDPSTAEPHVALGVALGLRGKGYGDAGLLRLIVGQEHHRVADGYPRGAAERPPHLFSRIVALADAFSNLEVGTPWAAAVSPAEALRALRADPYRYEGPLVDVLEGVLGRTPRGTLLRLRDGSTVVVIDGGARRGQRPLARRLLDARGAPDPLETLVEVDDPAAADELAPGAVERDWQRSLLA